MEALTEPPTSESLTATAATDNKNNESAALSTGSSIASETEVLSSKKGSRKRSRETTLTDKPDTAPGSPPQLSSKRASEERASKKSKGYSWEQEAEAVITSRCMETLEISQIEAGRPPFSVDMHKFYAKTFTVLLRHLKSASPEAYSTNLSKVSTAHDDWITLRRKQSWPSYQKSSNGLVLAQAQTRVIDAISAFFHSDRLIELHPYLIGNPRLQKMLRDLQLPIDKLKKAVSDLHPGQQNTDATRQRRAAIKDLLVWLSPKQAWSSSDGPSYNDTIARGKHETVMRIELDQGKILQLDADTLQANEGRATHLREKVPETIAKSTDSTPEWQNYLEGFKDAIVKNQEIIHAKVSSLADAMTQPRQSETTHGESIAAKARENKSEIAASTSPQAAKDEQLNMRDPEVEAILTAARAEPYQNARAAIGQQNLDSLMKFARLQNWGTSYNIIINQLIDAEKGGPPPMSLDALQMPDNDACYYRLQDLWVQIGRILYVYDDFQQLLVSPNKCYDFAICVREVHCLLRLLKYRRGTYQDILATGWKVEKVRRLQTMMVAYMREEPLVWSKPDVDAICEMLQTASNEENAKRGKSNSFAATVAATAAHETTTSENGRQPVHQLQVANKNSSHQGKWVFVPPEQPALAQATMGYAAPIQQIPFPVQPSTHPEAVTNTMEIDAAPPPVQSEYQAGPETVPRDSEVDLDLYCRNFLSKKGCAGCQRKHEVPPPSLVSLAQVAKASKKNGQINLQPGNAPKQPTPQPQAGKPRLVCRFFAAGHCTKGQNCKFSHDPADFAANGMQFPVTQQPYGDVTMDGAASSGDNRGDPAAATQNARRNVQCRHESKNKICKKWDCGFLHLNPQSRNFSRNGLHPNANGQANLGQQQQGNNQGRASNNFTYDPAVHGTNLGAFLQPQQPQTQQDTQAWVGQQNQPHPAQGLMPPPPVPTRGNSHNANNGGNSQRRGQGLQCYICKQFGHKQGTCPSATTNGASNQQDGNQRRGNHSGGNHHGGGGGFTGNCHSCGGQGHKAINCPSNAGQAGAARGQYAPSVISAL